MKKIKTDLVVFFAGLLLLFWWYHPVLLNLNAPFFVESGDGLKNYYSVVYQVKYGEEFWKFSGMNYPYGEHIVFTDSQPLLVLLLKMVVFVFPSAANHLPAIMNFLMLISLPFSAVFIQRIFKHYDLNNFFSITAALAIAFFSPQLLRINGHYALAYMCLIPLFYLLLIKQLKRNSLMLSFVIGLCLFCSGFLHLYYLLIISFFIGAVLLVKAIRTKKYLQQFIHLSIQVIIPFAVALIILKVTDPITDRPTEPYGFLVYRAYWEGFLLSTDSPIIRWINQNILEIRYVGFEATVYFGFFSVMCLLSGLIYLIANKGKAKAIAVPDKNILIGGLLVTLFSLGFPFILGLDFLVAYTGPLQQFRSIARFAWPMYYVVGITSVVVIYRLRKELFARKLLLAFFCISALVFLLEINKRNEKVAAQASSSSMFPAAPIEKYCASHANDYQAIIPIPSFYIGAECMSKRAPDDFSTLLLSISMEEGIPLMSNMASRTSFEQASNYFDLFYGNLVAQSLCTKDSRPYLLVLQKGYEGITLAEQNIINSANKVYETDAYILKSLSTLDVSQKPTPTVFHNPVLSDKTLKNNEVISLPFDEQKQPRKILLSRTKPTSQQEFGKFSLYLYSNGQKTDLPIYGNEDLIKVDSLSYTYSKAIDVNMAVNKLEFEPKLVGENASVVIKNLEIVYE